MPLVNYKYGPATFNPDPVIPVPGQEPGIGELAGAAMRTQSTIVAAADLLKRKRYKPDPNFYVTDHLKKNYPGLIESGMAFPFATAKSLEEFEDIRLRREKEMRDREMLRNAGWTGVALEMAAGTLDPTLFIPLVGTYTKGFKAVAEGAGYLGFAVTMQEAVLRQAQEARPTMETTLSIGAGVILGGVLGGTVGALRKAGQLEELVSRTEKDFLDEAVEEGVETERPRFNEASSIGAAKAFDAPKGTVGIAGKTKGVGSRFGTKSWGLESLGPVTRTLNSPLMTARYMIAQFSDAGLRLYGNATGNVAAEGGTLWARRAYWNRHLSIGLQKLDELYAKYIFGSGGPNVLRASRAVARGLTDNSKLGQVEFFNEVSRAMREGSAYEGLAEAKEAADMLTKEVYSPIFEEMKRIGMVGEDVKLVGDEAYLNRVYNIRQIKADMNEFINILERHVKEKRAADVEKEATALQVQQAEIQQEIQDFLLPEAASQELSGQLAAHLADLTSSDNIVQGILDDIADFRAEAKQAASVGDQALERELLDRVDALRQQHKQPISEWRSQTRELRKRLRTLNKTYDKLMDKRRNGIIKMAQIEDQQVDSLRRLGKRFTTLQKKMDKLKPEQLEKEVGRLKATAVDVLEKLERQNKIISSIISRDKGDISQFLELQAAYLPKFTRLRRAIEKMEEAASAELRGPELIEELIDLQEAVLVSTNRLNANRTHRIAKMEQRLKDIDPEAVLNRLREKGQRVKDKESEFFDRWRKAGIDIEDLGDEIKFEDTGSRQIAQEITDSIIGSPIGRLSGYELLQERGPELARMLDIPSREMEKFLENNVEKLVRTYVRTLAPDVEIFRRFGSVNADNWLMKLKQERDDLIEASRDASAKQGVLDRLKKEIADAKAADNKAEAGRLIEHRKAVLEDLDAGDINAAFDRAAEDIQAVIGRMRHTWGLPDDPSGWAARGARIAMNINTLRFMGMVAISSLPDVARTVMKYGPVRAYKSGLKPLIQGNFRALALSKKEAQLAGTGLDVVLHTRFFEMAELADEFASRSRVEQGLEFATSKIGIVSGFDYWNTGMKQLGAVLFNAEVLDAIQTVIEGGTKGLKKQKEAQEFLASINLDAGTVDDIWRLVNAQENGGLVDGIRLPNSDEWEVLAEEAGLSPARAREVQRTFRAALVREIDSMIVTPGLERPLWMDRSLTGKILGQFRSFAFSSTFQTTMAGLQQKNANFALGSAMSLGLGALSYYLWGVTSGNNTLDEDWDKWADEMIDRSGMIGVFAEVRNIGSTIPFLNDYVMLSGEQTTRRGGTGFAGAIGGPSHDLLMTIGALAAGLDDPTQGTTRLARKLMPYQNVWWARQFVFDNLVEGINEQLNLPADRR
jgi:predicted nucleic acid-binding protein